MPIQITSKPVADVVKKAALPEPMVEAKLGARNGRDGILVEAFFPLPEDEQVDKKERYGKGENKDTLTSTLSILGRGRKVDLTYLGENGTDRYAVLDENGNQVQFTGQIFVRVGGEDDDDTTV